MIKNIKFLMALLGSIAVLSSTGVATAQTLNAQSVGDFGGAHPNFPASNTIDGNTNFSSRWAANYNDAGGEVNLFIDLGSVQTVGEIGVAWGSGNTRSYNFEVRARAGTSGSWTKIRNRADSSGETNNIEVYDVNDFAARQVRIKVFSTEGNRAYADVTEFQLYGTGGASSSSSSSSGSNVVSVPGRIEAEDYADFADNDSVNQGGAYRTDAVDIQACGDTSCGFNVGWTADGEWLEYDVDVERSGNYQARVRLASRSGAGEFSIDVNGDDRTGDVEVDSTGNWQSYYTETVDLGSLNSGDQTIRFNIVDNGFNLNWIEIVEGGGSSSSSSSSGGTFSPPAVTGQTFNATVDSLEDVIDSVSGGDEIVVTGRGEISLKNYNFSSPVIIRAATVGGTTLDNATIDNSNNIVLQGFVFGPNEESTLLKIVNSTNVYVLRNLFDHEDITENQTSIVMTQASRFIEIGYNEFRDKNISDVNGSKITGSFIKTQFDDPLMTRDLHIFRNHFNNIAPYLDGATPAGDSDREAIAMGIADSQDVDTNNIVEYNLFENCDGENEIITVKTSSNIFRFNTFQNSMGSLSLRLGSDNEVYGNYFFGEGSGNDVTDDNYQTGGVRVYGSGHVIYDNYMENLTGLSWRRPILIDSGDTSDSTGNDSHETPTNTEVRTNTIVNSVGGGIHIGSDNYSRQPTNIEISDNVVVSDQGILYNNHAVQSLNTWTGNTAFAEGSAIVNGGGFLGSSSINVLSNEPNINKPAALSASQVGRFAQ